MPASRCVCDGGGGFLFGSPGYREPEKQRERSLWNRRAAAARSRSVCALPGRRLGRPAPASPLPAPTGQAEGRAAGPSAVPRQDRTGLWATVLLINLSSSWLVRAVPRRVIVLFHQINMPNSSWPRSIK